MSIEIEKMKNKLNRDLSSSTLVEVGVSAI